MVFEIATCKIKAGIPGCFFQVSEFFIAVLEMYTVSSSSKYDFELVIHPVPVPRETIAFDPFDKTRILDNKDGSTTIIQNMSVCVIQWDKKRASVSFSEQLDKPEILFFDYLKLLASVLLVWKGGIPLHCSTVLLNGKGVAFFGDSGVGKSTITRLLSEQGPRLNDDVNFIAKDESGYVVHSTPFMKSENFLETSHGFVPLSSLVNLSHGERNIVSEMSVREKVFSLATSLTTVPVSNAFSAKILENIENICRCIPVLKLSFKNDTSIINAIPSFTRDMT